MKVHPLGELLDVPGLGDDLRYGRDALVGVKQISERLSRWKAWTVNAQNNRNKCRGRPIFVWNVGISTSPRFETACLLWMYARALFRLGNYFEAREAYARCASQVLMSRDRLGPITLLACGKARLRCLVRSQRDAISELGDDPEGVASRAMWLVHAERAYEQLAGPRKEERVGEGLFFAAEAVMANRDGRDDDASHLATRATTFPSRDFEGIPRARHGVAPWERIATRSGAFDWTYFSRK